MLNLASTVSAAVPGSPPLLADFLQLATGPGNEFRSCCWIFRKALPCCSSHSPAHCPACGWPVATRRPVPARQGDMAAEVAQGALAHPGAAADGADEALGEVGLLALGAGTGGGLADEHAPMEAGPGARVREL